LEAAIGVEPMMRTVVSWARLLEVIKYVLRTRYRPQGEEVVIRICEGPAAADRYEARVAIFGKDHDCT